MEELLYVNQLSRILKSFCKYEIWQKHITGLEEFVISYVLDRDAFNSLIRYLGQKNFSACDWTARKPQHGSKQIRGTVDASGLYMLLNIVSGIF